MNTQVSLRRIMTGLLCLVAVLFFAGPVRAQDGGEEAQEEVQNKLEGGMNASGQIVMNMIEIKGKIDRPQAVYIINLAKPNFKGIKLEKDFIEDVKDENFKGIEEFDVDEYMPAEDF